MALLFSISPRLLLRRSLPRMSHKMATRCVRLRQPRMAHHTERMQLLTYPMALAQRGATVPLLQGSLAPQHHRNMAKQRSRGEALHKACQDRAGCVGKLPPAPPSFPPSSAAGESGEVVEPEGRASEDGPAMRDLFTPRRWVRDADELCIAAMRRSNNINRINSYIATYKFDDPQWRSFLLPEVRVLPKAPQQKGLVDDPSRLSSSSPPPSPPREASAFPGAEHFDVFIDYNKLTTLELVSRHANFALRHLVQKGHAMYFVNYAQHSILQMRGLVEASYVTCAYGIRGERLRTHIVHTGPVDVREVLVIHPQTLHVSFDLKKPNVRRGVVAVSTVEGYGTWFQRKPMLWQRTRRIGALQSQLGSYDYELCDSAEVGRMYPYAVSLLAPHVRLLGQRGGAEAIGIVASSQVAQNDRLYMTQFEAPIFTAVDAVHQLIHRTALHHRLLRPALTSASSNPEEVNANELPAALHEDPLLQEQRRLAGMERFLPVSWVTRTPPPYVPLESDLPFRIQLSRPAVIRTDVQRGRGVAAATFPTGGTVGSPFVCGVPLSLFEYNIHQGVDHYIYDDAPSARPLKWWSQKSNIPYNGYIYGMRSGLLDFVRPAEKVLNPLAPRGASSSSTTRTGVEGASAKPGRRRRRRHARVQHRRPSKVVAEAASSGKEDENVDAPHPSAESPHDEGEVEAQPSTDGASSETHGDEVHDMPLNLTAEQLAAGETELCGHGDEDRREMAMAWEAAGHNVSTADRPPLYTLVAPNSVAQTRLRRYARSGDAGTTTTAPREDTEAAAVPSPSATAPLPKSDGNAALRRRLRAARRKV